tara:strand:+ start:112 stop:468 length:357 start_codon:yes stop_codon:yes gene_type:complete
MIAQYIKKGLGILSLVALSACSNPAGQYVGTWQNVGMNGETLEIRQSGNSNGFLLKLKTSKESSQGVTEHGFTGVMDKGLLQVSVPMMGVTPLIIDGDRLHFTDMRSCKNCDIWIKIK